MSYLNRIVIALAFPVGFFLGIVAFLLMQLTAMGAVTVALILLVGFGFVIFADHLLDRIFWRGMDGLAEAATAEQRAKNRREERWVSRQSWKVGACGGLVGVAASAIWGPLAVMDALQPVLNLI